MKEGVTADIWSNESLGVVHSRLHSADIPPSPDINDAELSVCLMLVASCPAWSGPNQS